MIEDLLWTMGSYLEDRKGEYKDLQLKDLGSTTGAPTFQPWDLEQVLSPS